MIVVSNTTPITNLARIGRLDLLRGLYGQLHIAAAVSDELNRGPGWPGQRAVQGARWILTHRVADLALVAVLQADLDAGEAEAIALAIELGAHLLLMDETLGRQSAARLGLRQVGLVGVLLQAKHRGLVKVIRPLLDDLRQKAGFWLREPVVQRALELAGEWPPDEE